MSLSLAAAAARVEAVLHQSGVEPNRLRFSLRPLKPDAAGRGLCLFLHIGANIPEGSRVEISAVLVAGRPIRGLPFNVCVRRGIQSSLVLTGCSDFDDVTPCISPEGCLYCPSSQMSPAVLVFNADGVPLLDLPIACHGFTEAAFSSAWFSHGDAPSLLLADCRTLSLLVAVDLTIRTARWKETVQRGDDYITGLAVLPALGIAVVSSGSCLVAHRLSDGNCVGTLEVAEQILRLAADSATGTVYGVAINGIGASVHAWSCAADGLSIKISARGIVAAAGSRKCDRSLAVVPPAPGKMVSHLAVGSDGQEELILLALPDLSLVHTHVLKGVAVVALAADPWGRSLAVCDRASKSIHVLAWPLPGMPPLE